MTVFFPLGENDLFSDDECESNHEMDVEADVDIDVDGAIKFMLDSNPDVGVSSSKFPDAPQLDLNFDPTPELEQQRKDRISITKNDEDFIRSSMNSLSLPAPPWASSLSEQNWKDELQKHLSKTSWYNFLFF